MSPSEVWRGYHHHHHNNVGTITRIFFTIRFGWWHWLENQYNHHHHKLRLDIHPFHQVVVLIIIQVCNLCTVGIWLTTNTYFRPIIADIFPPGGNMAGQNLLEITKMIIIVFSIEINQHHWLVRPAWWQWLGNQYQTRRLLSIWCLDHHHHHPQGSHHKIIIKMDVQGTWVLSALCHSLASLSINLHQSTSASISTNQHQSASNSINQHQPVSISISINQHKLASICINQDQLASISINQHQTGSIRINQHQSASASMTMC